MICPVTKPPTGDRRWIAAFILQLIGGGLVLITRGLRDSCSELVGTATYSIGWTLLTFGALYLLNKQF
jgi:hypothetical protein